MMKSGYFQRTSCIALALALAPMLLLATPIRAQSNSQLSEIIVTARKRVNRRGKLTP
jgi:hypothetical protein